MSIMKFCGKPNRIAARVHVVYGILEKHDQNGQRCH